MATAVFGNAIGWAQFRILGGWKNIIGTVIAYTVALGSLMFVLARLNGTAASVTYSFFLGIFLGLQVLAALIYGSMRVSGAVRNDVTSGVIESHRLMPVSPMSAVLGYLFGSTFQAMWLFAANFVLGAIAVSAAHLSMQSWVICNGVLLWFAMCIWTIVQFFGYRSTFGAMGGILVLIAGWWLIAGGGALLPVPALQVLFTPLIGHTIFDMRSGLGGIDKAYLVGGVGQLAIGWLYCLASAERYRRDDLVGFNPVIAILLLGVVTAASLAGMLHPDWFMTFGRFRIAPMERETAFEMSVILVLLLAILPISSAVRLSVVPPAGMTRRHLGPMLAVVGSFVISMGLVLAPPPV
ncbi:MAG TPA: hypothetical protein VN541_22960, partial [Tepidisphaeraceae bacterium]|nr:hypothetical protein [Tepidisphaeraceae bacterium]